MGRWIVAGALIIVVLAFVAFGLYLTGNPIPILHDYGIGR